MTGGTCATASYPQLQKMVDNTPAGPDDRDEWLVEAGLGASRSAAAMTRSAGSTRRPRPRPESRESRPRRNTLEDPRRLR